MKYPASPTSYCNLFNYSYSIFLSDKNVLKQESLSLIHSWISNSINFFHVGHLFSESAQQLKFTIFAALTGKANNLQQTCCRALFEGNSLIFISAKGHCAFWTHRVRSSIFAKTLFLIKPNFARNIISILHYAW